MPYDAQKRGRKWVVVNENTGMVVAHANTKAGAEEAMKARYAHEPLTVKQHDQHMAEQAKK